MPPTTTVHISHADYDRLPELLAQHDITIGDDSHTVHEELPAGNVTHSHAGTLHFRGRKIPYERKKDNRGAHVEITIADIAPDVLDPLLEILDKLFPEQGEHLPPNPPSVPVPWYRDSGCFVSLLVFAALVFFLLLGIRTFLSWF